MLGISSIFVLNLGNNLTIFNEGTNLVKCDITVFWVKNFRENIHDDQAKHVDFHKITVCKLF